MHFSGKNKVSRNCFRIYNVLFVLARLAAIFLSIIVFWFGLKNSSLESINFEEKNFNTPMIRTGSLVVILLLQAWMMWNFIIFQCKKMRENSKTSSTKLIIKPNQRKNKAVRESSDTDGDAREELSDSEKIKSN